MIALRRHLHANPELSNEEVETQRHLRRALEAEGLGPVRDVAGTGLAVEITGDIPGSNRALAIRADIDALPIHEETGLPFASQKPGVMHACGHDAHAAMALAAAAALAKRRNEFSGTVRFIFQPAEEAEPLGGRRVVEEGLLDDVEAAIGIHVDPYLETGRIAVAAGPFTLASDIFDIVVTGRSAHAATPQQGIDALAIAAAMVGEAQKLIARETGPFEPAVLSVTGFKAGGAYNIIADRAELKGTIRSGSRESRVRLRRRLEEIAKAVASAHGASAGVTVVEGEPAVINEPEMVKLVSEAARNAIAADSVVDLPGWAAADDFGFYSQKLPAVYFRLGVMQPEATETYALHHPKFRIDEAAMPLGAATLARAALDFLAGR
ncbi:MAG: amidohydrolase [Rhizobiales bacterium]|nr:amidohydrolase [Hyphomicrobiales bacterium]